MITKIRRAVDDFVLVGGGLLIGMSTYDAGWFRWVSLGMGIVAVITGVVDGRLDFGEEEKVKPNEPAPPLVQYPDDSYWKPWPPT